MPPPGGRETQKVERTGEHREAGQDGNGPPGHACPVRAAPWCRRRKRRRPQGIARRQGKREAVQLQHGQQGLALVRSLHQYLKLLADVLFITRDANLLLR